MVNISTKGTLVSIEKETLAHLKFKNMIEKQQREVEFIHASP